MNQIWAEIILELVRWNWIDRVVLVLSAANVVILFLTYKWVKKYTIEAKLQTTAAMKQTSLYSLPSLQTRFIKNSVVQNEGGTYSIKAELLFTNIGNGTASNVLLKSVAFDRHEDLLFTKPDPDLSQYIFTPGQKEDIYCLYYNLEGPGLKYTIDRIQSIWEKEEIKITLWFQDIMGNPYRQENKYVKGRYYQGPPIFKLPSRMKKVEY